MKFGRPIAISLSPNAQVDDVICSLQALIRPFSWQKGKFIKKTEQWLKIFFKADHVLTFNSGRSALFLLLKALGIQKGDEVLLQSFTCSAAVEPIIWLGAKPKYLDVNLRTLNIDVDDLVKKITNKTKVLILQHTFGNPADLEKILNIVETNKLFLIEDCAHSIGATYKSKKIGTFGDAAFFSFGRDKVISCVFGGALIIKDKDLFQKVYKLYDRLVFPSLDWIFQQMLHTILFFVILPFYNFFNIGKLLIFFFQKVKFLSPPIYLEEKRGLKPKIFPAKLPNAQAQLLLNQFKKLDKFNKHRQEIANYYENKLTRKEKFHFNYGCIYLRYPFYIQDPQKLFIFLKKRGILVGTWYSNIIDPKGVNFDKFYYKRGSCRNAEKLASKIINLPTHILLDIKQAVYLVDTINKFITKD